MNYKCNFLLISLFLLIKSETWYGEITGNNQNDSKNGYAGSKGKSITGFYLCGTRRYRVHFLGDAKQLWSKEYQSCEPVGIGKSIDGIAISGGKGYQVRLKNGKWLNMVYKYDINDLNNGMAGILGNEIDSIIVKGGNRYRVCIGDFSSAPEVVAERVIKNWFGISVSFMFKDRIKLFDNNKLEVYAEIINKASINFDGKIKMIIENFKITDYSCEGIEFSAVNEFIENVLGDSFADFKNWAISFSNGMENGQVTVTIDFIFKTIVFEAATKITKGFGSFRGAFRIIFQVKDEPDNLKSSIVVANAFEPYVEEEKKKEYRDKILNLNNLGGMPNIIEDVPNSYQIALGLCAAINVIGNALRTVPIL